MPQRRQSLSDVKGVFEQPRARLCPQAMAVISYSTYLSYRSLYGGKAVGSVPVPCGIRVLFPQGASHGHYSEDSVWSPSLILWQDPRVLFPH